MFVPGRAVLCCAFRVGCLYKFVHVSMFLHVFFMCSSCCYMIIHACSCLFMFVHGHSLIVIWFQARVWGHFSLCCGLTFVLPYSLQSARLRPPGPVETQPLPTSWDRKNASAICGCLHLLPSSPSSASSLLAGLLRCPSYGALSTRRPYTPDVHGNLRRGTN